MPRSADSATHVILIGGPSNSGKSTLSRVLGQRLGWTVRSTDKMGRHPGRPWSSDGVLPEHVIEHYSTLSVDELFARVLVHYKSMWPKIEGLVKECVGKRRPSPMVLEGSALWPETVSSLKLDGVKALWLSPSDQLLRFRILSGAKFSEANEKERALVLKFLGRALEYNRRMIEATQRLDLMRLPVDETSTPADLADACLAALGSEVKR